VIGKTENAITIPFVGVIDISIGHVDTMVLT